MNYEGHLFFQIVQNFIYNSKMSKNIQENVFGLHIIAFELVLKKWPITKRIPVIGSERVNKQS